MSESGVRLHNSLTGFFDSSWGPAHFLWLCDFLFGEVEVPPQKQHILPWLLYLGPRWFSDYWRSSTYLFYLEISANQSTLEPISHSRCSLQIYHQINGIGGYRRLNIALQKKWLLIYILMKPMPFTICEASLLSTVSVPTPPVPTRKYGCMSRPPFVCNKSYDILLFSNALFNHLKHTGHFSDSDLFTIAFQAVCVGEYERSR